VCVQIFINRYLSAQQSFQVFCFLIAMAVTAFIEDATPIFKWQYIAIIVPLSYTVSLCKPLISARDDYMGQIYFLCYTLYNIYLHPLSSFPGPKSHAEIDLTFVHTLLNGNLTHETHQLYKNYRQVVRVVPNELSYNSAKSYLRKSLAYAEMHLIITRFLWNFDRGADENLLEA